MAFKLSKTELVQRDELLAALRDKWADVETAAQLLRNTMEVAYSQLNETITKYQDEVTGAEAFRDEVASRLRDEFDKRSETWQQSDAGSTAEEMVTSWENLDIAEFDTVETPDFDLEDAGHADELEALPVEI